MWSVLGLCEGIGGSGCKTSGGGRFVGGMTQFKLRTVGPGLDASPILADLLCL